MVIMNKLEYLYIQQQFYFKTGYLYNLVHRGLYESIPISIIFYRLEKIAF